jgi:hypothetical protein
MAKGGVQEGVPPRGQGEALVVEYRNRAGEWKAFWAEVFPEVIDDEIKLCQVAWNWATASLRAEDVYDLVPPTYPKANVVQGFPSFPGMGRLDLQVWRQENMPVLSMVGWLKLALTIASKDLDNLRGVFTVAEKELRKQGEDTT